MDVTKTTHLSHAVRNLNAVARGLDTTVRTLIDLREDAAAVEVRVTINGEDVSAIVKSAVESRVKQALPEILQAELALLQQKATEFKVKVQTARAVGR